KDDKILKCFSDCALLDCPECNFLKALDTESDITINNKIVKDDHLTVYSNLVFIKNIYSIKKNLKKEEEDKTMLLIDYFKDLKAEMKDKLELLNFTCQFFKEQSHYVKKHNCISNTLFLYPEYVNIDKTCPNVN